MRSAIVFVVDRLGAGYLGPYGNTWLETPHFNQLAARSLLCETVLADSPTLDAGCRAFWTGRHALEPDAGSEAALAARAARHGTRTLLITDDASVANHPLAASFDQLMLVEGTARERAAAAVDQTQLFRLVAAAIEAIGEGPDPVLAWIHSRGMSAAWDAPPDFRQQLADGEDPAPPDLVAPPERRLDRQVDPDEVLGLVQAYAGQVQLVDECLGTLMEALQPRLRREEVLLAVTSPRGYPLGEHGRVGACDEALYSELLQVPLLIELPSGAGRLVRSQRLIQPRHLYATIVEACGWGELSAAERAASLLRDVNGEDNAFVNCAVAIAEGQRAIRTPAWQMRELRGPDEPHYELFAKPDDRWESNEVSSRCGDVVPLLAAELDRFEQAARSGQLAELAPPPEILLDSWR